jgi:hypothetical protein
MTAVSRLMQGDINKLHLLKSAYITLLLKTTTTIEIKDYRPISVIHKLASKLLALVSSCQSAFVKDRIIHDNFILVHQTVRALHHQKRPQVLLKLDISKAFNSVSWSFLFKVLSHLGFGPFWCGILSKVLWSPSIRILVNGEPGELICHQRGLC